VQNTYRRVDVAPPPEVITIKPRRPLWVLVLVGAGLLAVAVLAFVVLGPSHKEMHPGGPVIELQALSGNNYNGCGGGVTVCKYSFPSNVTEGNTMVVGIALNDAPNITITSSGAGCRSTKWIPSARATYGSFLSESTFTGVASGSGPCQVTASVPLPTAIGIQLGEYSGVDSSPIDAYGTMAESGNATVNFSAGNATTVSGDLAVVLWCSQNINSSTPMGWTATFNQKYIGGLTQYHIQNGTTVNFTSTDFPSSGVSTGVMLVLKG
jgi:hypothetical protein